MSINRKLTLGIVLSLAVTVLILYGLLAQVFLRGFGAVERMDARQNVDRVVRAFNGNIETLNDIVVSWSQWDDSYAFILGKNPSFIKANVTPNTYETIKVNILLFFDKTGKLVYQGAVDSSMRPIPVPDSVLAMLAPGSFLLQHKGPGDAKKGFLVLDGQPYLVAASPIVNSSADSEVGGTMAVLRLFDEAEVAHLSEITKLKLSFTPATSPASRESIRLLSEDTLLASTAIPDVFGKNGLTASAEIPRLVHKQGQATIHYLLLCLIVMGCALVLVTIVLTHILVIRRVKRLSSEVAQRRDSLEFSTPVVCNGKDEIAGLARTINGMLAHVDTVLQKLSQ